MKKVILTVIVTLLFVNVPVAWAEILIFDTSDSQFDAGVDNQGWWSDTRESRDENDSYAIGISPDEEIFHNFFTFDLSSLAYPVLSATLELTRFMYASSADSEVLGLFDVSTDAVNLNNNTAINLTIFNDLGTGASYGEFDILSEGLETDILTFELNASAIGDINAAMGGWFSIGGTLLSPGSPVGDGTEGVFGTSNGSGVQRLVLEVVPEPTTILSLGLGTLLLRRRSRIKA